MVVGSCGWLALGFCGVVGRHGILVMGLVGLSFVVWLASLCFCVWLVGMVEMVHRGLHVTTNQPGTPALKLINEGKDNP